MESMSDQNISVALEEDRAVIALVGEHEAYTAEKLARTISGLLEEGASIAIDLRQTTFIDSTVVGVLLAGRRRAAARGLSFMLLMGEETGWPVKRVLEVTGVVAQFDVAAG
jgi:anti-sigma B factor antagonist